MACPMPTTTKENSRISIYKFNHDDASSFDLVCMVKYYFMIFDVMYITPDNEALIENEISIMDLKFFTFRHFMKFTMNLGTLQVFLHCIQEAVPHRLGSTHFVNCSPIFLKLMALSRPFIKKEIYDQLNVHTSGYELMHKQIPKELLPFEYGGSAGPIEEFYHKWNETFIARNDYIKNKSNWELLKQQFINFVTLF